ncbi:MAG TPA: hypothetical protein VGF92_22035 [Stellaceae bacterium]
MAASISRAVRRPPPEEKAPRLVFAEQAVFLDGCGDGGSRERGSNLLLDQLGARGG